MKVAFILFILLIGIVTAGAFGVGGEGNDIGSVGKVNPGVPPVIPITIASTTYIDPTAGVNGSGTCVSPKNTWTGISLTGNVAFLQKAGTTFTGVVSPVLQTSGAGVSAVAPLILGTYDPATCGRITDGSQRAIIDAANTKAIGIVIQHNYVWIDSLEIKNTSNGMCVEFNSAQPTNGVVKNSYIHNCRDAGADFAAGIWAECPNCQFLNNIIDTIGTDGIFAQGANLVITGNTISNVSVDQADGDGIQVADTNLDSSNPIISRNTIDHSSTDHKTNIIVNQSGGSSSGCFVTFNTGRSASNSTLSFGMSIGFPNCVVYGNIIAQGLHGLDILSTATNTHITGNVFTNTSVVANTLGIANNGATGVVLANNVIVNTTGTFANFTQGIYSVAGDQVSINNIVQGWQTGFSGGTSSYSDYFGNQTNGTIGTGSITTNPQFIGNGNYQLQAGSPALGTGTNPNVTVVTPLGTVMTAPFNMGAY